MTDAPTRSDPAVWRAPAQTGACDTTQDELGRRKGASVVWWGAIRGRCHWRNIERLTHLTAKTVRPLGSATSSAADPVSNMDDCLGGPVMTCPWACGHTGTQAQPGHGAPSHLAPAYTRAVARSRQALCGNNWTAKSQVSAYIAAGALQLRKHGCTSTLATNVTYDVSASS